MKKAMIFLLAAATMGLTAQAHAVDAAKAQELAKSKNCLTCHSIDNKLVGPAYKEVAKKYKGDKSAEAELVKRVINGSSGNWGAIPMPPNPVTQQEATLLVEWILSL
ncbi:MAG: c-type cytochrome [Burkholderiales bacterium]|jgi:cytochrome c